MMVFFLRLTSIAVMPLFTVYVMGVLTRVHRRSGTLGLAVGIAYGLSSFLGDRYGWPLPIWWTNTWWAYVWSIVFTASAMLGVSAIWGWATEEEVRGLTYSLRQRNGTEMGPPSATPLKAARARSGKISG